MYVIFHTDWRRKLEIVVKAQLDFSDFLYAFELLDGVFNLQKPVFL